MLWGFTVLSRVDFLIGFVLLNLRKRVILWIAERAAPNIKKGGGGK
jgi:hypothetical protein